MTTIKACGTCPAVANEGPCTAAAYSLERVLSTHWHFGAKPTATCVTGEDLGSLMLLPMTHNYSDPAEYNLTICILTL